MAPKILNIKGEFYGKWEVLESAGRDKYNLALWKCRCECGTIKILPMCDLRGGSSTQCKKCSHRQYVGKISGNMFYQIKSTAIKRNRMFSLTKEFLWDLYIKQNGKCSLSKVDIDFADTTYEHQRGKTTASLDRIDSSKGYTKDNVQWVHKDINWMKQDFDQSYFIEMCRKVAENNSNA